MNETRHWRRAPASFSSDAVITGTHVIPLKTLGQTHTAWGWLASSRSFGEANAPKRRFMRNRAIPFLALALCACGGGGSGGESSTNSSGGGITPQMSCAALISLRLGAAFVSQATPTTAGYCAVFGSINGASLFEMRLPNVWSQRYIHIGGGNFDGSLPNLDDDSRGAFTALQRGFVVAASDGGHEGGSSQPGGVAFDLTFATNHDLLLDFTYRAIGTLDDIAKQIIAAYYAAPLHYSYFSGCSAGGREALNAATFFPQSYDGIVAGSPAVAQAGSLAARVRTANAVFNTPGGSLTTGQIATIEAATLAACDGLDGLNDGLIANQAACHVDLGALRCSGAASDACLTDAQLATVRTIHEDTTLSDGTVVYSHYGFGAESVPANNWQHYYTDWSPNPMPENFLLMNAMLKYAIFSPSFDWRSFDIDRDYPTVLQALTDAKWQLQPTGLNVYASMGKKLIMWQGASDYSISANETARFYADMVRSVGQVQANAFPRFFVLPSVQHCGGGPGASTFDQIGAITDWVEQGKAPEGLVASKLASTGSVTFTRPICSYPTYPRYSGAGDPNKAQSFACVAP